MQRLFNTNKVGSGFKTIVSIIFLNLTFNISLLHKAVEAQTSLGLFLPTPGTMITLSPSIEPILLKGVTINPENPFQFDFIVDIGDSNLEGDSLKNASEKLIKYFMASLTIPENEMWVNLSPYEDDRIITQSFGSTEMGRDLLSQDYVLKQLTSSLMYPEKELGQKFWDNVYEKAYKEYGTTDIPVDTFNKVWIVPSKAVVYEHGQTAFVAESHLKVLLEEDYNALQHQNNIENDNIGADLSSARSLREPTQDLTRQKYSDIVREIIVPAIEKEVNQGEHFSQLRQITSSLILASWYKKRLQESILSKVYVDKSKINGVDIIDRNMKNKIYKQYLEAFRIGAYNFIKEEYDPASQQIIPRKYFSGGKDYTAITERLEIETEIERLSKEGQDEVLETITKTQNGTEVFTIKANLEIDNSMMGNEEHKALIASAQELLQFDLDNKPMSVFVDWMDKIIDTIDSELTQKQFVALAEQLGATNNLVQRISGNTNNMANRASDFAQALPKDGKINVFLMRDGFSLYTASKTLGEKVNALYLSKATFRTFTQIPIMADLLIPQIIMETKRRISISRTEVVPAERFQEFKDEFFNLVEELASDKTIDNIGKDYEYLLKVRENIRLAIGALSNYLEVLGITSDDIAKDGIRFIDTTKTGSLVLFMESVARSMLKAKDPTVTPADNITDGKMFFSDLSSAYSYKENITLADAREIESTFYPVEFSRRLSEKGEPIVSSPSNSANDKKNFLLQMILLKSELIRTNKENIRPSTATISEASREFQEEQSSARAEDITFDQAKQTLVTDIYKKVNTSTLELVGENISTIEDIQKHLEQSSYAWKTAHPDKRKNLIGVLSVLQNNLIPFIERQYPGINIKSVSIGGSMVEFWSSYPADARMPYGEDLDVYVVADNAGYGVLKLSLAKFVQGQMITEELAELSVYGVSEMDVWVTPENSTDVNFYMMFGSGVTIWGKPLSITQEQYDPIMVIGRVERLIGVNAWDMTGRLIVANWLLRGLAQRLGLEYTEYTKDINENKAEALKVIQANYESVMLHLAKNKIAEQSAESNTDKTDRVEADKTVGGIDLNTSNMDFEINSDGQEFSIPVNLQQIESINIDGLVPVIFNISPTTNLQMLLGVSESDPDYLAKISLNSI
ncbi:MAG: hypothetical protein KJ736_05400 [Candidatus Omnitrophica bacterium]|nr:hypothetical protein [Candidatus Omnitrophota bacterium]